MEEPGDGQQQPQQINLEDLNPEQREAYELKQQLQGMREGVCDASLFEEAEKAQTPSVNVKIRRRRDLKGHLTKVPLII